METQNVKLSLPRDLVRKARHVAVERCVSLSALVGSCLEEVVAPEQSYDQARDRAITRMRQGLSMGLGERPAWTSAELHERSLEETAYLLRSPRNVMRLIEAIADLEGGRGEDGKLAE